MAGDEGFLSRWSRRKHAATAPAGEEPPPSAAPAAGAPVAPPDARRADREEGEAPAGRAPLPPVESLGPESDFTPFMARDVDGATRNQALKALFADPHFNAMDMLDVYVDDYSKPDPIPESWLGKLEQVARLGDRAARDREEEERRRALASAPDGAPPEGRSGGEAGPAGAAGGEGGREASAPGTAPPEPGGSPAVPREGGNPPTNAGESGT